MSILKRITKSFINNTVQFTQVVIENVKPLIVMGMATIGISSKLVKAGVSPALSLSAGILAVITLCN